MNVLTKMNHSELMRAKDHLTKEYEDHKGKKLSLDMTRGKPCSEQLDLSKDMLTVLGTGDVASKDGTDCRNYGLTAGIMESREIFADILGISAQQVVVGNNSSLALMHDALVRALLFGEIESDKPWSQETKRKWLCPVPGYDRHFLLTETLGFELIPVPMTSEGPDMDVVEALVAKDASIKGMWCVPLYSNPDGYIYSAAVCERLAAMKTAALDFRVFWDNAYVVHHLYQDKQGSIPEILSLAAKAGNPNRFYQFASTSKVTLAGAGISAISSNTDNVARIMKYLSVQTIGPDKINGLRHARFLKDREGLEILMQKHSDIIRPKFEKVLAILDTELSGTEAAWWNKPLGGYFVSLYVYPKTAKRVVTLAKEAGVALTPAGSTFPHGHDPKDENIRIAPTFPKIEDVEKAMYVLTTCVKLAAVEQLLLEV